MKLTSTQITLKYLNILIYGESGVGKTRLCATAPNPLIISAEAGLLSLSGYDIDVFEIKKRKDCDEIYDFLTMSKDASKYSTICIDSLSEIAEVLLTDEKKNTKDARQAYGIMNDEMQIVVRGFRDLPFNVYFAAKNKKIEDEGTRTTYHQPSLPGKAMLENLPYFFDIVGKMDYGRLDDGTRFRYISTVGDRFHVAKDRSGLLSPMEKPDLSYIIKKIIGNPFPVENVYAQPTQEDKQTPESKTDESVERMTQTLKQTEKALQPEKKPAWKPN